MDDFRECLEIEDAANGLPHLFHHEADGAGRFIQAIFTGLISGDTDTAHGGERAIDCPYDATERDLIRRIVQHISSMLSPLTVQEPSEFEVEHDGLQELLRNLLGRSNFLYGNRGLTVVSGQK